MEVKNAAKQQIQLRDGRMLGYAEYGAPDGKPIFCFHGLPGSRISFAPDGPDSTLNARLIAVDRPGIGLSDFKPGRQLLDWPDDVVELADLLKLDRFAVLGVSGGGGGLDISRTILNGAEATTHADIADDSEISGQIPFTNERRCLCTG